MGRTYNKNLAVIQIPRPSIIITLFASILLFGPAVNTSPFPSSSPVPSSSALRALGAGAGEACGDLIGSDDLLDQLFDSPDNMIL